MVPEWRLIDVDVTSSRQLLTYLVAKTGGQKSTFATQPGSHQIYDQTKVHKIKDIDNAFDLM